MPSKKKKKKAAKGKGRAAAKSRDKGLKDDSAGSDVKPDVKNVELRMQRLQINNNDQDDETALLEEAINLAAAEREQLGSAASNVERCDHGFSSLPRRHVCTRFVREFAHAFHNCCESSTSDKLKNAFKATGKEFTMKYDAVWSNSDMLDNVMSHFLAEGTNMLLRGQDDVARQSAALAVVFKVWRDTIASGSMGDFRCYGKITELSSCDEHTLVSFFKKRIPCKCLNEKYKEVKSIVKMGHCNNPDCPLPDRQTELSKLMNCEECRTLHYCSIECQRAHWPSHKKDCATMRAALLKARETK